MDGPDTLSGEHACNLIDGFCLFILFDCLFIGGSSIRIRALCSATSTSAPRPKAWIVNPKRIPLLFAVIV